MARPEDIPVAQVKTMRAQGITDDKIVETLQRDGYQSSQIFDAMTQADMKPAKDEKSVTSNFPDISSNVNAPLPEVPEAPLPPPGAQSILPMPKSSGTDEVTEELIESIIDEKWSEIEESVSTIVDWKNDTEKKINNIESGLTSLKEQFDKLHQAIIGKVGEYDKNILNVSAEVKAVQKAFSKIIPEFAESVREMTDLVETLRKENRKK